MLMCPPQARGGCVDLAMAMLTPTAPYPPTTSTIACFACVFLRALPHAVFRFDNLTSSSSRIVLYFQGAALHRERPQVSGCIVKALTCTSYGYGAYLLDFVGRLLLLNPVSVSSCCVSIDKSDLLGNKHIGDCSRHCSTSVHSIHNGRSQGSGSEGGGCGGQDKLHGSRHPIESNPQRDCRSDQVLASHRRRAPECL